MQWFGEPLLAVGFDGGDTIILLTENT